MDLYVFVDNTCVEIFKIEKKSIDDINKYLKELEDDGINYTVAICRDTCFPKGDEEDEETPVDDYYFSDGMHW